MQSPSEERELLAVAQLGAVQVKSLTAMLMKRNAELEAVKGQLKQALEENAQLKRDAGLATIMPKVPQA